MEVPVRAVGTGARPPLAGAGPAATPPRPVPQMPAVGTAAMAAERPVRTAALLALIFGLLVIVPFVTQVMALIFGAVALGRRRLPNERVAGAWIGVMLAIVALLC